MKTTMKLLWTIIFTVTVAISNSAQAQSEPKTLEQKLDSILTIWPSGCPLTQEKLDTMLGYPEAGHKKKPATSSMSLMNAAPPPTPGDPPNTTNSESVLPELVSLENSLSPYVFYGFPDFSSGSWLTITLPNTYFPWHLNSSYKVNTNGVPSAQSYALSVQYSRSTIYITMLLNDTNKYGNNVPYWVNFWSYNSMTSSDQSTFSVNDIIKLQLPYTESGWTRHSYYLPATRDITNKFSWTIQKYYSGTYFTPYMGLDAVQLVPVLPAGNDPDFNISLSGTNVVVKWLQNLFPPSQWKLAVATNVVGPYLVDTNLVPTTLVVTNSLGSNYFSAVTLPAVGPQKFFRLDKP
ncbi:MAG: hypothetical protein NT155_03510 [Candidatus Staskawiczbacteria bacterium]|nr:hypothetical protein [Candidatus Staskawiczbacteria bacterium]